jgi:hypothetical protein
MALFELLAAVIDALDRAGVPHMVSGSLASARHGEARATQDIDIVIDPSETQMTELLDLLSATGWYVGDGAAALSRRTDFNVVESSSGWKVDLIVRKDRPYSREEFERRRPATIGGVDLWMVTAEDSILSKLEWGSSSRSERQLRDVKAVVEQQRETLDWDYLTRWAHELGVADLLAEAADESG